VRNLPLRTLKSTLDLFRSRHDLLPRAGLAMSRKVFAFVFGDVSGDALTLSPYRAKGELHDESGDIVRPNEGLTVRGFAVDGTGRAGMGLVSVVGAELRNITMRNRCRRRLRSGSRPAHGTGSVDNHRRMQRLTWGSALLLEPGPRKRCLHGLRHRGELHHGVPTGRNGHPVRERSRSERYSRSVHVRAPATLSLATARWEPLTPAAG
jgi:hypothetical protein